MSYKQLGGVNVFSSMSKIKTNDLVTENLFTKMLEIDGEMFITNSKSGVNDVLVFEGIGDEEWKFVLDNSDNSNMTLTSKENNRTFKISNNNSTNDIISFNGGGDGIQAYKDIDMCYNSITNITNISSGPTRGNILFSDKDIGGNTKNFFLNDNRDFTCLVAGSHPGTKLTISNRPLYFGNWNHAFGRTILDFDTNLSQNWNNPTIANRPASSRIESVSLRKDDYEQGALNFWNTWEVVPGGGGGGSDGIMELMMTMTNKTIIHSDLDMSNNRIIDLSDGIQPSDAVTLRQLTNHTLYDIDKTFTTNTNLYDSSFNLNRTILNTECLLTASFTYLSSMDTPPTPGLVDINILLDNQVIFKTAENRTGIFSVPVYIETILPPISTSTPLNFGFNIPATPFVINITDLIIKIEPIYNKQIINV